MPQKPSPWDLPKSSKTKITTGDVDLDKILNDTNLDVTADRLSDFISKRKMDRRTVWQGLIPKPTRPSLDLRVLLRQTK